METRYQSEWTQEAPEGKLNITVFGPSLYSSSSATAPYFHGLFDALSQLGCRITTYEPDVPDRSLDRRFESGGSVRSVLYTDQPSALRACLRQAMESDVIIIIGSADGSDEQIDEAILDTRREEQAVLYWETGGPASLEYVRKHPDDRFCRRLEQFDLLLTRGGGCRLTRAWERLGARQCVPIHGALNPQVHFPQRTEEGILADFSLYLDHRPEREEKVEEFFFRPARMLQDRIFLLAGQGWQRYGSMPKNVQCVGPLTANRRNILNSSSEAVLNILDNDDGYGPFVSDHFFEAAGAAACVLTEDFEGLEGFLMPQSECISIQDGPQVTEVLETLTIQTSRSIGLNARRRMRREHTCACRAKTILQRLAEVLLRSGVK